MIQREKDEMRGKRKKKKGGSLDEKGQRSSHLARTIVKREWISGG